MIGLLLFILTATAGDDIHIRSCRPTGHLTKNVQKTTGMRSARRTSEVNPYTGDRRQLVVLVSFNDQQFKEEEPLPLWDRIFNEVNFMEAPYHGSVHDYFDAQSYGLLNLVFDLHYVALDESRVKYHSTETEDDNSRFLVEDIVAALKDRDIDWGTYDWDEDGYIDQLLIIYAGMGQNAGGDQNTIWPHQWWLSLYDDGSPCPVSKDDKDYLVDCYCCIQEVYVDDNSSSFGTICHEYSHCFGFPDLYGVSKCVGRWDLMDYGNNNENGFCPPGYSALERMLMGWLDMTELTEPSVITDLGCLDDHPDAYMIRNDGYPDEFYIIENRQQKGWDQSLPGSGIVIVHVDYDEAIWEIGIPNFGDHKRYSIIPANGKSYYTAANAEEWAYPYGEKDSLTNLSDPAAMLFYENTDGTTFMNKPIWDMKVSAGIASFTFIEEPTGIWGRKAKGQPEILYDLGSIYIIRNARGEIKKVIKH